MISKGVLILITLVFEVYFITVLNKIIETASFKIPSPNTMLKRVGSYSQLIKDIAAITSEEQSKLHINRHSELVNSKSFQIPVFPSIYFIKPRFFIDIVIAEKQKNPTKVPRIPNVKIFFRFPKKLPLCILNPDANTIGGKQIQKKVLSLNFSNLMNSQLF